MNHFDAVVIKDCVFSEKIWTVRAGGAVILWRRDIADRELKLLLLPIPEFRGDPGAPIPPT